jgi:hypothetical protein
MTQANIILNQLGGINRITAMTGAYNFLYVKTGVCFHFKSPHSNYEVSVSGDEIILSGKDLIH